MTKKYMTSKARIVRFAIDNKMGKRYSKQACQEFFLFYQNGNLGLEDALNIFLDRETVKWQLQ